VRRRDDLTFCGRGYYEDGSELGYEENAAIIG